MKFKIHPVVKIVIYWDENEEQKAIDYREWLEKKQIYPATRGGNGGSLLKNSHHYSVEDAKQIETYLSEVGQKSQILPS